MQKHTLNKKRAFTLVELLIVIVIISILFVVLISRLDFTTNKSKSAGVQSDLKAYYTAANSAAIAYVGFAEDTTTLMHNLNRFLDTKLDLTVEGGSLKTDAQDPWGTDYLILVARPEGTFGEVTFVSAGPDRSYFTNDDQAVTVVCTGAGLVNTTFPLQRAHHHHFEQIECGEALKKPATCKSPATYYYSCAECKMKNNDVFEKGDFNPDQHNTLMYEYLDNGDPATHITTTKCVDCNGILHSVNEPHVEEGGYCTKCGASAHVHIYDQVVADANTKLASATCTSAAVYYKSCLCGQKGTETFTSGSALGHSFTEEKPTLSYLATKATCSERATYYHSCSRCGIAGTTTFTSGGLGSHVYNQQVATDAYLSSLASCTLPAQYFHSCACGEKGTTTFMSGTPNGHQYAAATCTLPQTCSVCHLSSGSAGGHHEQYVGTHDVHSNCSICGVVIRANHVYGSEITTPGTCTDKGITTYTCLCGYSYTEQNVAKNFDNHSGSPTNGGDAGVHTKYSCCGVTISTEHQYVGSVVDPGDCTTNGWTKYECSCGYYYTSQDVPASGHTYDQEVALPEYLKQAATCQGIALYYKSCECGAAGTEWFESGTINGGVHTGQIVNVGTNGVHTKYDCCDAVASTTHQYTKTTEVSGNCQTDGIDRYTCSCGYSYTSNIGKKLNVHTGTVVTAGEAKKHTKYNCCGAVASSTHSYTTQTTGNACSGTTTTYTCSCGYSYNASSGGSGHTYNLESDSIVYQWSNGCESCYATATCRNCDATLTEVGTTIRIDKTNVSNYDKVSAEASSYNVQTCCGYRYDYIAQFETIPDGRCSDWHYYGTPDPDNHNYVDDECTDCHATQVHGDIWLKYTAIKSTVYTSETPETVTRAYTVKADPGIDTIVWEAWTSYSFSSSGFYGRGTSYTKTFRAGDTFNPDNYLDIIGKWVVMGTGRVVKIKSIDNVEYSNSQLSVTYTISAESNGIGYIVFGRGGGNYLSSSELPSGSIPSGEVIDGSYEAGYVVIKQGNSYYWYEKKESN